MCIAVGRDDTLYGARITIDAANVESINSAHCDRANERGNRATTCGHKVKRNAYSLSWWARAPLPSEQNTFTVCGGADEKGPSPYWREAFPNSVRC